MQSRGPGTGYMLENDVRDTKLLPPVPDLLQGADHLSADAAQMVRLKGLLHEILVQMQQTGRRRIPGKPQLLRQPVRQHHAHFTSGEDADDLIGRKCGEQMIRISVISDQDGLL